MFKRALGFLFFLTIVAVVGLNFKQILAFGQAHEIRQSAQKAVEAQNWEKAIQLYEAGLKRYPENIDIKLRLAWLYRKNQQPEKSESSYRAILKREPDNKAAMLGLASLLEASPARINEAIVQLRKALKAHPHDARLLNQVGNLYKSAAENPEESRPGTKKWLYEQSRYYYKMSLKQNPRQFQTQFNLGVANQNLEDLQPSAQAYCQAIILNPNSYEAHYNLGLVLSSLDYLDEAYRQMNRSVKILTEKDDIETAQKLALKVQTIKNRVFNSNKQGLSSRQNPEFLDKACLSPEMSGENSEAAKQTEASQTE